jgi:hypothetical protein
MEQFEEAVGYLAEALSRSDSYREELLTDPALAALNNFKPFIKLTGKHA